MANYHKDSLLFSTKFKFLLVVTFAAILTLGLKNVSQNYGVNTVLGESTQVQNSEQEQNREQNRIEEQNREQEMENEQEDSDEDRGHELDVEPLSKIRFETENHVQIKLETRHSKIEISSEEGRLKIKAKHEDGTEIELEEESLDRINEMFEDDDFEIATTSGNGFLVRKGVFQAKTHFPLSLNPDTNELTVTTPAGVKVVAVLPDKAVANLIGWKFIDEVASSSADTGIELELHSNTSSFKIKGIDKQKFLGLLPVNIDKTIFVSSENGEVLSVDQSFLSRLLDLLSIK